MALNIPVGISNFTEIRSNNYYYVDKTNLIYELLQSPGTEVIMITRPRRFGTVSYTHLSDGCMECNPLAIACA